MILKKYSSILIAFIVLFLVSVSPFAKILHPKIWIIFSFFLALDFLVKILLDQAFDNNRENFIQFYLATVVLRFILLLIFIAFGLYRYKENQQLFILNIFAFYLFFTIFEISTILRKLRRF